MRLCSAFALSVAMSRLLSAAGSEPPAPQTAAGIAASLAQLSIDPEQCYHVRDLQLIRGDLKFFLTEGVLYFARPIAGHSLAAVFTTAHSEGGDGELILLPPRPSERASLAAFANAPNLDEHFSSAVFFFSDETAKEIMTQIQANPLHPAADALDLIETINPILRSASAPIDVRLTESLLDNHPRARGFFYGMIAGRTIGAFDGVYEPDFFEPVSVGRLGATPGEEERFQLWTSFRPRRMPPYVVPPPRIHDYVIDTVIHPDLSMSSAAKFTYLAGPADGPVIALKIARRLRVSAAAIDGQPAEVFQHNFANMDGAKGPADFLVISKDPLVPGSEHRVDIRYQGSVIRQTKSGAYFVAERNAWYPFVGPTRSNFDLTFHFPRDLRLAATGEPVAEDVTGAVRTVHRKTAVPEALAGFNLGNYSISNQDHGRYRVELYANPDSLPESELALSSQTAGILEYFSHRWLPLPIHTVAVSPIEGYFGQGFPGLIYLSHISYIRQEDRPSALRNPRLDAFFSELLLPHEIAHQWWGNIVDQADYRSAWLLEAMSNYAALQYLEQTKGKSVMDSILAFYREELTKPLKGTPGESAGPLDFGDRLEENSGMPAWQMIIYEKGAWVMHMLRRRLGDDAFQKLQIGVLQQYSSKPLANEDFRRAAQEFVPPGQADHSLALFFETWVYGVGIPKLALHRGSGSMLLTVSGVADDYSLDVPLRCGASPGKEQSHWVRANAGENSFEIPPGSTSCALPAATDFLFHPAS